MRVATLALLLAGCGMVPPPAGIQLALPARDGTRPLPVTVVDEAGIVLEAVAADAPAGFLGETSVVPVAGRDDAVVLAWMGGECDDRAIVTVLPDGARDRVTVESRTSAMSCSAVGVLRAVLLSLNRPVGADAFDPS